MKHGNEIPAQVAAPTAPETSGDNPLPLRTDEIAYDLSDMGDAPLLAVLENADGENQPGDAGTPDATPEGRGTLAEDKGALSPDSVKVSDAEKTPDGQNPEEGTSPDYSSGIALARGLISLGNSLISGDLPPEDLLPLLDAAKAREAIEIARREGEIAGRNALIEERLVTPPPCVPDLSGTPARNAAPASIFDLALHAR